MKKSFSIIGIIGFIFALNTDALAVWEEINVGFATFIHGGYKNTDSNKKLQAIHIKGIPRGRIFEVNIYVKPAFSNAVLTNLRALGFSLEAEENEELLAFLESHPLLVTIDMNHPDRVKTLLDELNRYEAIEPDTILAHMKTRVDSELASMRRDLGLPAESNSGSAQSTSASAASATSAHSASSASTSSSSSSSSTSRRVPHSVAAPLPPNGASEYRSPEGRQIYIFGERHSPNNNDTQQLGALNSIHQDLPFPLHAPIRSNAWFSGASLSRDSHSNANAASAQRSNSSSSPSSTDSEDEDTAERIRQVGRRIRAQLASSSTSSSSSGLQRVTSAANAQLLRSASVQPSVQAGSPAKNRSDETPSPWPPKEVAEIHPDEKQRKQWNEDADHRFAVRVADGISSSILGGNDWGSAETIMNEKHQNAFVDATNKLDARYPQAIPNTDFAFYSIYQLVNSLKIEPVKGGSSSSTKGSKDEVSEKDEKNTIEKKQKKEAALAFLQRVAEDFVKDRQQNPPYPYPLRPGMKHAETMLSIKQALALAFYAINDPNIFTTEKDRKDRQWSFISALATIQRAHNDSGKHDAIIWDRSKAADRPSCETGTWSRMLNHLDTSHPDVNISEIPQLVDVDPSAIILAVTHTQKDPAHKEVFITVQQQHSAVYNSLDPARKKELNKLIDAYYGDKITPAQLELSEVYGHYRSQLLTAVRTVAPLTKESQLNENTTVDGLAALISESLAASDTSSTAAASTSHSSSASSRHQ